MAQTVADILVATLEQIGVKHIFGLIGDSLNPLADAVRRSRIDWVGVRHEEGAALAAAGQAKLTGRLGVCAGTTGPGSTHLVAGLYEAARDHAPVLALSGDVPRKMHGTDFIQTTEPDLLFRDASLYTETVSSPAQAPAIIHQAIAAAYAGRGVAHLTLPQDVIAAKARVGTPECLVENAVVFLASDDAAILHSPDAGLRFFKGGPKIRLLHEPIPATLDAIGCLLLSGFLAGELEGKGRLSMSGAGPAVACISAAQVIGPANV
jgi:thiamine pyrophosphate-dependent acetolactate synthase large subunit-like protein